MDAAETRKGWVGRFPRAVPGGLSGEKTLRKGLCGRASGAEGCGGTKG